jgi:hypothetical protein
LRDVKALLKQRTDTFMAQVVEVQIWDGQGPAAFQEVFGQGLRVDGPDQLAGLRLVTRLA